MSRNILAPFVAFMSSTSPLIADTVAWPRRIPHCMTGQRTLHIWKRGSTLSPHTIDPNHNYRSRPEIGPQGCWSSFRRASPRCHAAQAYCCQPPTFLLSPPLSRPPWATIGPQLQLPYLGGNIPTMDVSSWLIRRFLLLPHPSSQKW